MRIEIHDPDGSMRWITLAAGTPVIVGRDPSAAVQLSDPERTVSRRHLELALVDGRVRVAVLGPNGARIDGAHYPLGTVLELRPGHEIGIGGWRLRVCNPSSAQPSGTQWVIARKRPPRVIVPHDDPTDDAETRPPATSELPPEPAPPCESESKERELEDFSDLLEREFRVREPDAIATLSKDALASASEGDGDTGATEWQRGRALFRVPRTMWTETAELAELRLAPTDALSTEMRAALERTMVARGETDEHQVDRVGRRMRAVLHADPRDVAVAPLGSEVQDFTGESMLAWDWRVTPLREGTSLLTLRLTMLAKLDGREIVVDARALHTSVTITVRSALTRPRRFVRDNWRWMLGSSGIGAAAGLYALFKP